MNQYCINHTIAGSRALYYLFDMSVFDAISPTGFKPSDILNMCEITDHGRNDSYAIAMARYVSGEVSKYKVFKITSLVQSSLLPHFANYISRIHSDTPFTLSGNKEHIYTGCDIEFIDPFPILACPYERIMVQGSSPIYVTWYITEHKCGVDYYVRIDNYTSLFISGGLILYVCGNDDEKTKLEYRFNAIRLLRKLQRKSRHNNYTRAKNILFENTSFCEDVIDIILQYRRKWY